jgi:hypothetical protein
MRHRRWLGPLSIAVILVSSSACQQAAQERKAAPQQKAAPATQPAPPTTTTVSDEARVRAALEPLAPEFRRCYPLLAKLNAALSAQKGESKAAEAFNACQTPASAKTVAVIQALKKEGLNEERIVTIVNQWRNEQMSSEAAASAGKKK